jgi:hypothetical protein
MDRPDDRPVVESGAGGGMNTVSAGSTIRDRDSGHRAARSIDVAETRRPMAWTLPSGVRRERVVHDRHTYSLRGTESRVLDTLATFRVVIERDLVEDVYSGHRARMGKELSSLESQGLVARRELASDQSGHHVRALTLTRDGQSLVQYHRDASRFSVVVGRPVQGEWGKACELVHDASLYRMYLVEEERILREGGTVLRVILDDELKQRLYRGLNEREEPLAESRQARLADLARAEDLPVVDGHVMLPDVRIEYETASGERSKVDLELTTDHYHAGHLAAKARAGFTLYSASGHAGRGVNSLGGGRGGSFDPHFLSGLLSL